MRQTWDEQRPNQGAILAYIAREAGAVGVGIHEGKPVSISPAPRYCVRFALLAVAVLLGWLLTRK